jgi:hypothetical protein
VRSLDAFARRLVGAFLLAALTPVALLLFGPVLGARTALFCLLSAAAAVAIASIDATPRARRGRRLLGHALLVVAAVAFAWWLALPGLFGSALALWGFGLVLSLGALLPSPDGETPHAGDDAFESARARALALLDEEL